MGNKGDFCDAASSSLSVARGRMNHVTTDGRDEKGFFGPELPEAKNEVTKQQNNQKSSINRNM